MKTLLFISVSLCLASVEAKLESDHVSVLTTPVVVTAERVCENVLNAECAAVVEMVPVKAGHERRGNDQLGLLRDHLDGMARSLRETEKSVTEMARQRDAAREDAARHQKNHTEVLREMAKLREELKTARSEEEWRRMASSLKDKVNAGALAHAEMQKFRNELQGAMKEFQAMKTDFGRAREELQDPIERTELKKSVACLQATQKKLTQEVELALQAKSRMAKDVEELKGVLKETEGKVREQMAEMKNVSRSLAEARAEQTKALADVDALRQQAAVDREKQIKLSKERDELRRGLDEKSKLAQAASKEAEVSKKRLAALEQQQERSGKELAELRGHLHTLEAEVNGKEQALAESVKVAQAAKESREAMEKNLAEAKNGLAKQEETLASLNTEINKVRERLKQAEADKEKAGGELKTIRNGLEETKEKLTLVTKAKSGLEQLLFKKTAEVRELKVALRKAQAEKARNQRSQEEAPTKVANTSQD